MIEAPVTWEGAEQIRPLIRPLESFTPHPRNARQGDVGAIVESLRRFGQTKPIVVQKRKRGADVIVAGNHMWMAARELGWTHIAATILELDDAEALAYLVADNRTQELGTYDDAALSAVLAELQATDNLLATGYDDEDVQRLLEDVSRDARKPLGSPDQLPDLPPAPRPQKGDIWTLGDHRVMVGDANDRADLTRLLEGVSPDLVFADPPYGMRLDTKFSGMGKTGHDYDPVRGDEQDFNASAVASHLDHIREQFWWGADYYRATIPHGGSWLVWDKRANDQGMDLDEQFGSHFELCWSRQRHRREILRILWAGIFGMAGEDTKRRVHPTQKPVELAEWFLSRWCGAGVVDPFLGSGTTLIAAERLGKACYGMEIEPRYAHVAIERWQDYSGARAVDDKGNEF